MRIKVDAVRKKDLAERWNGIADCCMLKMAAVSATG